MGKTQTMTYSPSSAAATSGFRASGRFYVTLAVLAVSAFTIQSTAAWLKVYFTKLPVPLIKPFYQLDPGRLGPEYSLHREQPEKLQEDLIENLGTHEYLNWALVDNSKRPEDATYQPRVFVTYYTGKPDMVPHNPRECMVASGFSLVDDKTIDVPVRRPDGSSVNIPVAVLQFEAPNKGMGGPAQRLTVLFFFEANGSFMTTRNEVRLATQALSDRYSYYAKFEIHFGNDRFNQLATAEDSRAAIGPLLNKLMPVLWQDHFQDWAALKAGKPPTEPAR